jgi:hypothetical protein
MRSANIQFDLEIPNLLGVLDKLNAGAIEVEEKEVDGNTSFLKNYTLYSATRASAGTHPRPHIGAVSSVFTG